MGAKIIVKAGVIKNLYDSSSFMIYVNETNYIKVRKTMERDIKSILGILKCLRSDGKIKSISLPRNKDMQAQLDCIVSLKSDFKTSINKIKEVFYK